VGRISLNEWLDFFGFTRYPFASTEAGSEEIYWPEHLAERLVKPDCFDRVLGEASEPKTVIVFAPRGSGKTACRVLLNYYCREGIGQGDRPSSETGGRILPVLHTCLHELVRQVGGEVSEVDEYHHVVEILRRAVQALTEVLLRDHEVVKRVQNLSKWRQLDLQWFFYVYPTYLSIEQFSFLRERVGLRALRRDEEVGDFGFLRNKVTPLVQKEIPEEVIALLNARLATSVVDQLCLFTELISELGFQAIYVLIDGLDEFTQTVNDPVAGATLLEPLLANLTLMNTIPRLAFKMFLPAEMKPFILRASSKVRRDRLAFETITWTEEKLLEILHRRLAVCSDFVIRSLDAVSVPELRGGVGGVEPTLAREARGNPRHLILLADFLVRAHCDRPLERPVEELGEAAYLLNEADLAEALTRFRAEFLEEGVASEMRAQSLIMIPAEAPMPGLTDQLRTNFPAPIALVYLDYSRRLEPLERFRRLLDLFEVTVAFIGVLLLAQLRALAGAKASEKLRSADLRLVEMTLGRWLVIWKRLPGLCSALGKSYYARKLQSLYVQEHSRLAAFSQLRNAFSHGAIRSEQAYAEMVERYQDDIRHFLSSLDFLAETRLVRVRDLRVKGKRFIHRARMYMGDNPNFPWKQIVLDSPLECEQVLILHSSGVLSLHPFLVVEICPECGQEELFIYQRLEDDHMSFLSYYSDHRLVTAQYREDFRQATGL